MKTFLNFFFATFFFSSSWLGGWSEVARNTNYSRYFLDFGNMQLVEPYTYAWILVNYLEPNRGGDLSEVQYIKVHCGDLVYRTLKIIRYGGPMGMGNVVDSFVPANAIDWTHATVGTAREAVVKNICENSIVE